MAMEQDLLFSLMRGKLAITAIAISTGSKFISAEEKAKTIVDEKGFPVNPTTERDKMTKSLGIDRSSVAGMGEDPITSAALSVVKLALGYNLNLGEVKALTYATESPEDAAKDHAISVIKAVNELARHLNKNGYDIGYLDPQDAPHVQSACVAGASNLAEKARNGIEGKTLIVMSDEARYQEGTVADETGGFGSVALLVEDTQSAQNNGLLVSSKLIGHYRKSVVDFSKPFTRVKDEKTGVALIIKHPIVFGAFSEMTYIYGTFMSLKKAFESKPDELRDWKKFTSNYLIVPHMPYPRMYDKAIVYAIRQLAKHDKQLAAQLFAQTQMQEPFFDGFKDQMAQMSFIIDIVNNSVKVERIIEQIKRLPEGAKGKLSEEVNANLEAIATSIVDKFEEIKERYKLSDKLVSLMDKTQLRLGDAKENGKCIENVREAFGEILTYIEEFLQRDNSYNNKIRKEKIPIFNEFMNKLKVVEVSKLSKEIGNIYTASFGLALGSALLGLQDELKVGKKIIIQAYGSGFEARTIVADPANRNFLYISKALENNIRYEFDNRKEVTAGEAHILRNKLDLKAADSILTRYEDFPKVNVEKLLGMASHFGKKSQQVKVKEKLRG